jgi:hypothetical protein
MKIISSQRFLDQEIVNDKIAEMTENGVSSISLPIYNAGYRDLDDDDLFILIDGHHRLAAAREMGIEIKFDDITAQNEFGILTGEELLADRYMDSNWYDIETGIDIW